ncbi:MAG: serB 1 [Thermoleophilia bacterium]|nr:serB 1 [Thermoleophilia bacterium]
MTQPVPHAGAAFFDVDRTLLAGASGLHLARPLRSSGLITARQLARTMLIQLTFASKGSDDAQLDRFTEGVKDLMKGWDRETVVRVIEDQIEHRIRPMVYRDALDRIAQHRAAGMRVYAVSATMEEIIEPLAELMGLDGGVATKMEVVDGLFTGEILSPCHGAQKADRLRELAEQEGIDLAQSVAYSDSITDEQFLRAVGRAYAVNPDKKLRALAEAEGWGILRFTERVRAPLHRRRGPRMAALAIITGLVYGWRGRRRARLRRNG